MFMKLIVNAFERAKSKITSTHTVGRLTSESDDEFDPNNSRPLCSLAPSITCQQPRSSLSKWLCTSQTLPNKAALSIKSNKVRRSTSWRSLKERGNNCIGHFAARAQSADQLHRNDKQCQRVSSLHKQQYHQPDLVHSSLVSSNHQRQKAFEHNQIRLSNCDGPASLPTYHKRFDRLSSTVVHYPDKQLTQSSSTKSHRRHVQETFLADNNKQCTGGDSGYSEESFSTTLSSYSRPFHISCPHCHCEQRSSFHSYKKSAENSSTDSSTSDTITNQQMNSSDFYYHLLQPKQILPASRSYPHIKPLPKAKAQSPATNPIGKQPQSKQKQIKTLGAKRRRHLSCDGSLWPKVQVQQLAVQRSSPVVSESDHTYPQRHFTTIGIIHDGLPLVSSKTVSSIVKGSRAAFDDLNLAAIELDSLRTSDPYRASVPSSHASSLSSSSSSINTDKQSKKSRAHMKKSYAPRRTYLVWHEYKNSSVLSATDGAKIFSVIRGDQVRLLRRVGKSMLLVQKEDDGSIGFLPQSCLAHDEINSFLSVKGLRETVL